MLLGLLQNSRFLRSDRLIKDCCDSIINKLKGSDDAAAAALYSHPSFVYVPSYVIHSSFDSSKPFKTISMVINWLSPITTTAPLDGHAKDVVNYCQAIASNLSTPELKRLQALPPSLAGVMIISAGALSKLESTEAVVADTHQKLVTTRDKLNHAIIGANVTILWHTRKEHTGE